MVAYLISGAVGAAVGALQLLLLSKFLFSVTAGKYSGVAVLIIAKLAVYGAVIAAALIFFPECIASLGIGFAAGMIIAALAVFYSQTKKQK